MILKSTFSGHFVSEYDFSKSCKRFAKQCWRKITNCHLVRSFRVDETQSQYMRDHWVDWARRLPLSAFIVWIGGHVADDLIINRPRTLTVEEMLSAIDRNTSGTTQRSAERFLENYYFGYPSDDPKARRVIGIFRRIVKKKVRRQMTKKTS